MNALGRRIDFFEPIHLEEMNQVKLLKRIDTKYWFHSDNLNNLLKSIRDDYYILHIKNSSVQSYATTYYDTDDHIMFLQHHNGKLNRFKVRRRSYTSSKLSFLEVKFKNNKGKTIKSRTSAQHGQIVFTEQEEEFLNNLIPYDCDCLHSSLSNEFKRITLVNKNFKERCTIDFNITFKTADQEIALNDLVIIEIKSDGHSSGSPLALALRDARIKKCGFSKYCIGCTVTNPHLKRNNFKQRIKKIEKTIKTTDNLYHIN
jgi:VTC domain-containing protein